MHSSIRGISKRRIVKAWTKYNSGFSLGKAEQRVIDKWNADLYAVSTSPFDRFLRIS